MLFGWYTEELGLKLRKNAKLNEVSSIARRSLINSVVWSCLRARSEVTALSHGYSRTDRRSNERNAKADCRIGKPIGGRAPPQRKPRQSSTGVGQVDDATSTTASGEIGGYKENSTPVKLRQWRGKEFGEKLPSVAEEDAELHHQCIPGSSGTARVGSNDSSARHSPTRRTTIRLRSGSYRLSDGPGEQDASSLCSVDASDRG